MFKKIEWSDIKKPNNEHCYHHVIGVTPFCRFVLTWKGHKENPLISLEKSPLGIEYWFGDSVEESKSDIQKLYEEKIKSCMLTPTTED